MDAETLDPATCRRARLSRDPRFDGKFFVGVRTTGVFCRPICPAVAPSERNVTYFRTAAAAAEAGFRACLRCRPECAPGTPAWAGASTTVARALRLMAEAPAGDETLEVLAARLGVGGRHLRRLFVEHLGASPVAVLQTGRLLSAKRLIDETDLPLTRVAMAAGFGSIRRFNAAFLESYGRSPRSLREAARQRVGSRSRARSTSSSSARARGLAAAGELSGRGGPPGTPGARPGYSFQLRYRPPFEWERLLGFLAGRAIPGVESVDGGVYRRSIAIAADTGWFEVARAEPGALRVDIHFPDPAQLLRIVSRVRRLFDLDADPIPIGRELGRDPMIGPLVQKRPGLRVPGAWEGFELGVRAILGQQVSVKAATTLAGRLVERFGEPLRYPEGSAGAAGVTHTFPPPPVLADANIATIGVPSARGDSIRALAQAVASGELSLAGDADPACFRERVRELPGVGEWTAEYIALRALGDPDAFPASDLGLLKATRCSTPRQLRERAEAWRPWRAYAVVHLWTQ